MSSTGYLGPRHLWKPPHPPPGPRLLPFRVRFPGPLRTLHMPRVQWRPGASPHTDSSTNSRSTEGEAHVVHNGCRSIVRPENAEVARRGSACVPQENNIAIRSPTNMRISQIAPPAALKSKRWRKLPRIWADVSQATNWKQSGHAARIKTIPPWWCRMPHPRYCVGRLLSYIRRLRKYRNIAQHNA